MPGSAFPTATARDGIVRVRGRLGGPELALARDDGVPREPVGHDQGAPEPGPEPPRLRRRLQLAHVLRHGGLEDPAGQAPRLPHVGFSVTKAYSATVRAGFSISNDALDTGGALREISGSQMGMKDGLYSEWTWFGQMQIQQMIMAKPLDDATSWVGAYTEIMKEKWDALIPAFKDCPYIELTNDYAGRAYLVQEDGRRAIQHE